jgi:hypothetical protein
MNIYTRMLMSVGLVMCATTVCASDLVAPSSLSVTAGDELLNFKADRMHFESDNTLFMQTIDDEIKLLKRNYTTESVDLNNTAVRQFAPTISQFIDGAVAKVAELAGIEKPAVRFFIADGALQYNAAAQQGARILTKKYQTFSVDQRTGRKTLIKEDTTVERSKVSAITVGAQLFRLFAWRRAALPLLAAVIGHEVGHIVFEHGSEAVAHEHEADLFAARLLKNGTDLIVALDMLALATNLYHGLKSVGVYQASIHDHVIAVVNKVIVDVPDMGELGKATTHSYATTALFHALRKADQKVVRHGTGDEVNEEIYRAAKRACLTPSLVFGVPAEEIQELCEQTERSAQFLQSFKKTHPAPLDRRSLIEAIAARR